MAQGMVVTLAYSRHHFLWPLFGQTLVEIIEGLEACWAFLGGVPHYLVIDNFTTAVASPPGRFASHGSVFAIASDMLSGVDL